MLLEQWTPLALDLHAKFGIDVASGILSERTWDWFEDRVLALVGQGGYLDRALGITTSTT